MTDYDDQTADTTPTFDIASIEAGNIVELYRTTTNVAPDPTVATPIATLTSALGGVEVMTDPGPLADGVYYYSAASATAPATTASCPRRYR